MDIFTPILNSNKEAWNFVHHLNKKEPTEEKKDTNSVPEWFK
jgi:hypothetical protein